MKWWSTRLLYKRGEAPTTWGRRNPVFGASLPIRPATPTHGREIGWNRRNRPNDVNLGSFGGTGRKGSHQFPIEQHATTTSRYLFGNVTHGCHLQGCAQHETTIGLFQVSRQQIMKSHGQSFSKKDNVGLDFARFAIGTTRNLRLFQYCILDDLHIGSRFAALCARGGTKVAMAFD